ncbi:MAG TPA: bifunctional glutamate N-acetyltransferase/amino-acid acetyltransferase ArgJ [Cycloclasticus sp.]|jgi:glutamate N-acetyltransferase/amino-acid N-acetyltransferase|nr:bifunctional glutamate N-acetyltransferase/amino-acid acetyltransferase ArgJ [Cycloclasticus sp.]HIL92974.1 bifunctional glutamate N-acetyltransferase/amino-acid acetyltransferase ArgJ [Cycloclasticus sp.]
MPVGGVVALTLKAISGIRIGTASAGISQTIRDDVTVFELAADTQVAAVFTKNKFCAAPVTLAKKHLKESTAKYLLINSGNANAGLGDVGLLSAQQCCQGLAAIANVEAANVLPFSTGVIGEPLPVDKLTAVLQGAVNNVAEDNWPSAAKAIMTTDTCEKGCSRTFELNGTEATITGIAKGSGMIHPNMATMLSYIATDMPIQQELLQKMLNKAADVSFNRITVDGDTSTNDAVVLMATSKVDVPLIDSQDDPRYGLFLSKLKEVCCYLAEAIVRDGEGATKLINIQVEHARSEQDAKEVAYTIAQSPLVKTAFFASNPNWGRILAAVGRANIANLNVDKVSIYLNDVCIVDAGKRAEDYTEEQGQAVMNQEEITVRVCLAQGDSKFSVLTCDLSYDYVKINAEYRS